MHIILSTILIFTVTLLYSQQGEPKWLEKLEELQLQPIVGFQIWSTFTHGMEVYDPQNQNYQPVENRFNTQVRRSRLGIKGKIYPNLKFNLTTALDLIGRDVLSATYGGANNGSSPALRLWNAYLQWKIKDKSDAFHLTAGYFVPQIGRESINSAFRVSSLEKSWSQNYLRRQLTGSGPGRASGLNLGGQVLHENRQLGFRYDFGLFNPLPQAFGGNSTGEQFAPLLVGRLVLQLGDPESGTYSISHLSNHFGQRNGVSIAFVSAFQGTTDWFDQQQALGIDWLINWQQFNIDGEHTVMRRKKNILAEPSAPSASTHFSTGYFRLSYNIILANGKVLEPLAMFSYFDGPTAPLHQKFADDLHSFSGKDHSYDIGINYYFNPDLKLSLHYVWNEGKPGAAGAGETINNFFAQSEIGAIRRGNWLGLGFIVIL